MSSLESDVLLLSGNLTSESYLHIDKFSQGTNDTLSVASSAIALQLLYALRIPAPSTVVLCFLGYLLLRIVVLVTYRLYFHPLSKFPGPKLTAATRLYEFYYHGLKPSEFQEQVKWMHSKYGPIVRISPEELSINDSEFNVDYFMKDRKLWKDPWYYTFGFKNSLFTLLDKDVHRLRQGHLAVQLSGSGLQKAFPIMNSEIFNLCKILENHASAGTTANLSVLLRKMANEIQRTFLLGNKYPISKDYAKDAKTAFHPLFRAMTWIRHFPFLRTVHDYVPTWLYENHLDIARFEQEAERGIRGLLAEYDKDEKKEDALLYRLISDDPSYRNNNSVAVVEEFMELQWGGREVLGHATMNICYRLTTRPECMARLREELIATNFEISTASFAELQQLPYLYAVCKEGIRMQLGGYFRIPRCNAEPVIYKDWVIPPNTSVSMCPNFFHYDPNVYPEPDKFRPERWLDPATKDICEHYWKPFGNGSRTCAGRNLAFEIVFRVTANIFSRFAIDFAELDEEACKKDGMLKAFPVGSSKGFTVKVHDLR